MKNLIIFCLLFIAAAHISYAQVGAPFVVSNSETVCGDFNGTETSYTRITISRVGETYPEQTVYLNASGSAIIPTAGTTFTIGACGGLAASDDYEVEEGCDYDEATFTGTPFLRIIQIDPDGVVTTSTVDLTGAAYTPSGTVYNEFCGGYNAAGSDGLTPGNGATFNLADAPYVEWTITNAALSAGTITYNGVTVDAITAMTWDCSAWIDENTFIVHYCPAVSGAGGDFFYSSAAAN